jgi:hypothetical protein
VLSAFAAMLVAAPVAGASSWASPVTVSGTDTAYLYPRVGIDAKGDVLAAWLQVSNFTLGQWDCPCRVRAAYRPAGGSFGAPVDVSQSMTNNDSGEQIYLAMASNGDAVVAWNDQDASGGIPYASIRPAGSSSSWQAPVALGSNGDDLGVDVNAVAMDAAGDAIALLGNEQAYTGADGPGNVYDAEVVTRPAGGSFNTAHPQTFGDGVHNVWPRALGMSPDGKAVLVMRVDGDDEATPLGDVSNALQVTTSSAAGAAFNSTPTTIESISDHPQAGVYPVVDSGSSTFPKAAIDDGGEYVVTYDANAADGSDTPKVSLNGAAGVAMGLPAIGIGSGPVVIAATGEAVAFWSDGDGGWSELVRSTGGAFGSSTSLGSSLPFLSSIANASNEPGANGQILLSYDAGGANSTDVGASIGSAGGVFPAPTTIGPNDDNLAFGTQGAIDANGEAAVAWSGGTSGYQVRVATYGNPASPPPSTHTLTVKRSGSGSGTVSSSPTGISCGSTCSKAYASGTQVTLSAKASSGSTFSGWSGGGCSGGGSCKMTLSADASVTATFTKSSSMPNTKITGHQVSKSKRQAKFTFKAVGKASGFQCALVKQPKKRHKAPKPKFSRCSSPKTYKHVAHGSYKFEVRALSSAGADKTPASTSFKI